MRPVAGNALAKSLGRSHVSLETLLALMDAARMRLLELKKP
ncbi:hypothetical protein [Bordetella ansorpii]|nr:hypothetical protein [Bordetella ansorpii]